MTAKNIDNKRKNAPKIMLVEDDKTQSVMYETMFEHFGYHLIVENDGRIAFDSIKREKPDLLFLDLLLGDISGVDILKKVKKNKDTKDAKVIILSNFTKKGLIDECKKNGAVDFMVKSKFVPRDIVMAAESHLNIKK